MSRAAELCLALALDTALGEPPLRLHPVVWMGQLIDRLEHPDVPRRRPSHPWETANLRDSHALHGAGGGARAARLVGAAGLAVGAAVVVAVALLARRLPWPLRGVVLWTLLSGRLLLREVAAVEQAVSTAGVEAGRERIARLVSRDTSALTEAQLRAAAVQTLAENVTDSVTATLWWWSLGGLPAAALHRWADTLDSRWGYLDRQWRDRGWAAARLDDLLAWVPARGTALLWHGRVDADLRREAARTPSPNGGWTMGAAALSTGARLEKPGAYVLHPDGVPPDGGTVPAALRDARRVIVGATVLALVVATVTDRVRGAR
jgi:adenosylcobinamide-phosphate synthase